MNAIRFAAITGVGVLTLTGCTSVSSTYGDCGTIVPTDSTPAMSVGNLLDGDNSGDVIRMFSDFDWEVVGAPDGKTLYSFAAPGFPVQNIAELELGSEFQVSSVSPQTEIAVLPNERFFLPFGGGEAVSGIESGPGSGEFSIQYDAVNPIFNPFLGSVPIEYALPLILSAPSLLHPPMVIVASCDYDILGIPDGSYDDFIHPNPGFDGVYAFPDATNIEIYPGYEPGRMVLTRNGNSFSVTSSIDDDRQPFAFSVMPMVSGDPTMETPRLTDLLTDQEIFWLSQYSQLSFAFDNFPDPNADLRPLVIYQESSGEDPETPVFSDTLTGEVDVPAIARLIAQETYNATPDEERLSQYELVVYSLFMEQLSATEVALSWDFQIMTIGEWLELGNTASQTPAPYLGPIFTTLPQSVNPGETITLTGSNLESVTGLELNGVSIEPVSVSGSAVSFVVPEQTLPGTQDLVAISSYGRLTLPGMLMVRELEQSSEPEASIKRIGDQARIFVKNVIGAGKIQFKVNGKEIAWIRAVDNTDPKLRFAGGFYYLVRTVDLVDGKNAIEIYVDGERIRRVAYTG